MASLAGREPRHQPVAQGARLAAAHAIARRLQEASLWSDGACTWMVEASDRRNPWSGEAHPEVAGGALYQGTAGIGLFLLELGNAVGDSRCMRHAVAALEHAVAASRGMPPHAFGFHSGRVGVAYVCARAAVLLRSERWATDARELLRPLYGRERHDVVLDVIGGAAGAIGPLLSIAAWLDEAAARESALRLAWRLADAARLKPYGWALPPSIQGQAQELTGLAHGAAGVGVALLTAACEAEARDLAAVGEAFFAYEDHAFDRELCNWPDYRNNALSAQLYQDRGGLRSRRLEEGKGWPHYVRAGMLAWCHGAPGIALARWRAYELTRISTHRHAAEVATARTAEAGLADGGGCLCHGAVGNIAVVAEAAEAAGRADWRETATVCLDELVERYERSGRPWPSGTIGGRPDPSLMLGEAGVGHVLVRLETRDVPSILLPPGPRTLPDGMPRGASEGTSVVQAALARAYPVMSRVRARLGGPRVSADGVTFPTGGAALLEDVRSLVARAPAPEQQQLLAAIEVERACIESTLRLTDYGILALAQGLADEEEIHWESESFRLASHCEVVDVDRDWMAWAHAGVEDLPPEADSARCVLIHWRGTEVVATTVAQATAVVLHAVRAWGTLNGVCAAILEASGAGNDPGVHRVQPWVQRELLALLRAGVLVRYGDTVASSVASEAAEGGQGAARE